MSETVLSVEEIRASLKEKLAPTRFPGMSGKMAAIVGMILGERFTEPALRGLVVTSDGFVLGRMEGDIGQNEFLGSSSDLLANWTRLLDCAGLTDNERDEAGIMFLAAVRQA